MASKKNQMTRAQYEAWLAAAKIVWGANQLDWPPHLREQCRKIEILREVRILEQLGMRYDVANRSLRLPSSNTGVTNSGIRGKR